MDSLESLQPKAAVRGILPDALVTVVSVQWHGSDALELTYKTPSGKLANEILYRHDEPRIEVVEHGLKETLRRRYEPFGPGYARVNEPKGRGDVVAKKRER